MSIKCMQLIKMERRIRDYFYLKPKRRVDVVLRCSCRVQLDHSKCMLNMIIRMNKVMKVMKPCSLKESINGLAGVSIDLKC